jgi:hypothetical protein
MLRDPADQAMRPLQNMAYADLNKYGVKLLDNSISEEDLKEFFEKYNGPGGPALDNIMNRCFKYLDEAQVYQLCLRLLKIEAEINGPNKSFLRNKSPATLCIKEYMTRCGYLKKIFTSFEQCDNPADFILVNLDTPHNIRCLFKYAFAHLPNLNKAELANLFIFNGVTTPISLMINELEDINRIRAISTKLKVFNESNSDHVAHHQRSIVDLVNDGTESPALQTKKSARDIQNDQIGLRNDIAALTEAGQQDLCCTWPTLFKQTQKTDEEIDLIHKTCTLNIVIRHIDIAKGNDIRQIMRAVVQTAEIIEAVSNHHPHWIDDELRNKTIVFYQKAKSKLKNINSDQAKALYKLIPAYISKVEQMHIQQKRPSPVNVL